MAKYIVNVREVHVSMMEIEAESEEEAIKEVARGGGEEVALEYSHTLETDYWTVDED